MKPADPHDPDKIGDVPAWAQREDARSRRDEVEAGRMGWSLVLQAAIPLAMILLAGVFAWFGLR